MVTWFYLMIMMWEVRQVAIKLAGTMSSGQSSRRRLQRYAPSTSAWDGPHSLSHRKELQGVKKIYRRASVGCRLASTLELALLLAHQPARAGMCLRHGPIEYGRCQRIVMDCEHRAGWYPLLTLSVDDALEQARESLADHPELQRLIADGCAYVGSHWESYGDELYEAKRWAINVAVKYAKAEGLELQVLDDDDLAGEEVDCP